MTVSQEPTEIIGADPKEPPRTAAQWAEVQNEAMGGNPMATQSQQQAPAQAPAEQQGGGRYTDEDLERVRREEKDKLYGRINQMDEQLKAIQKEREDREAALRAEQEAEAERARREEEEKMDLRDLLTRKEQEWAERVTELERTYETDRALFEKERRLNEVEQYRTARVQQEAEYIMPELRDLIRGDDENAIDASIEEMKARTAAIMGNIGSVVQEQRQSMRGAAPTAPPVGPLEQMKSYESITPDDIRSMDMETYKKYRASLLNASGRAYRNG